MTKICDFPYPIYKLTKSLMMIAAGTVALNIIYEGLLLILLLVIMKKKLLHSIQVYVKNETIWTKQSKLIPQFCPKWLKNHILEAVDTYMAQIRENTPLQGKMHPLAVHVQLHFTSFFLAKHLNSLLIPDLLSNLLIRSCAYFEQQMQ